MSAVQSSYLTSPNWPNRYTSGSSCIYTIIAPANSVIEAKCELYIDSTSNSCSTDRLYIESEGEKSLARAEFFCGTGTVTRTSLFNSMSIAYTSNSANYAGRWRCDIRTYQTSTCDCGWSVTVCLIFYFFFWDT